MDSLFWSKWCTWVLHEATILAKWCEPQSIYTAKPFCAPNCFVPGNLSSFNKSKLWVHVKHSRCCTFLTSSMSLVASDDVAVLKTSYSHVYCTLLRISWGSHFHSCGLTVISTWVQTTWWAGLRAMQRWVPRWLLHAMLPAVHVHTKPFTHRVDTDDMKLWEEHKPIAFG